MDKLKIKLERAIIWTDDFFLLTGTRYSDSNCKTNIVPCCELFVMEISSM